MLSYASFGLAFLIRPIGGIYLVTLAIASVVKKR